MSRSPADYLRHILYEVDFLLEQIEDLTKEAFLQDETRKRAFVRSLEVKTDARVDATLLITLPLYLLATNGGGAPAAYC